MPKAPLRSLPLLLAALTGAAACQAVDDVERERSAILGGTQTGSGQFPTVVAIVIDQGARGLCTGTLVAPDIVLTAAHCVHPAVLGYPSQAAVTAATLVVFDSTDLRQNGNAVAAAETIPVGSFNQPGDPDVGIIRLSRSITDREPSPINLDPAAAPVGISVTMVGYGQDENGGFGRGLYLENKTSFSCTNVGSSDQTFLCFDQRNGTGKCSGDSGGPSFAMIGGKQTVVGITSFGDQNCEFFGADMRVDAAADFLAQVAPELLCGENGSCEETCGEGGLPVDPDCSDCAVDGDCEDGHICDAGFCIAQPGTPGGLGAACGEGQPECESGQCASGPDGMRCTRTCDPAASDCPDGFECLEAGGAGACWPAEEHGSCAIGGGPAGGSGGRGGLAVLLLSIVIAAAGWRRRAA